MKVKIKTWDKMLEENKLDRFGDIKGPISYFTRTMEEDMPKNRLINIVRSNNWNAGTRVWSIHDWMIEDDTLEKIIGDL